MVNKTVSIILISVLMIPVGYRNKKSMIGAFGRHRVDKTKKRRFQTKPAFCILLISLVGARGFEPPASCSQIRQPSKIFIL